jgi:ISXO2-like transposase domain/Transposase zinc-ribbon domain
MKTKSESREPKFTPQMTIRQFERIFPNEDSCRLYLISRRWPNGVACPRCGKPDNVYALAKPWHWECSNPECRKGNAYRFSLTVKTIFENTKYPLRTWFWVLFLMLTSKKGISALQVHRMIGSGSYSTAFYMCHRLRAAMHDPEFRQLMGIVEIDETFIGGKEANKHRSKRMGNVSIAGKIPFIGAISRKGNVVSKMIEDTDTIALDSFVRKAVNRERIDLIATDEHSGYRLLGTGGDAFALPHGVVRHSAGEYVRGIVLTNTIEGFWSLLKRGIMGTYHNVSKKYLPLYLAEFQFR